MEKRNESLEIKKDVLDDRADNDEVGNLNEVIHLDKTKVKCDEEKRLNE